MARRSAVAEPTRVCAILLACSVEGVFALPHACHEASSRFLAPVYGPLVFRDDHEAALARVTALQAELAREQADDADREQRLAALTAELAEAKSKLQRVESELASYKPAPSPAPEPLDVITEPPQDADTRRTRVIVTFLIAVIVIFVLTLIAMRGSRDRDDRVNLPHVNNISADRLAVMAELRAVGNRYLPGSFLAEFRAEGVTRDGLLHAEYGNLHVQFARAMTQAPPPSPSEVPIGAAPPMPVPIAECVIATRTASGWNEDVTGATVWPCMLPREQALEPRCSMQQIWARAIAQGASQDAIATLKFLGSQWQFSINDQRFEFSRSYPDDCGAALP
jgi:hypothetical protein